MIIEVKGVQFVNKGAELMLIAILQQLKKSLPQASFALAPGPNSPYTQRVKTGALQKVTLRKNRLDLNCISYYLPRRFRLWLREKWGLVTESDIDVILDASGFAYGDQWGHMLVLHMSKEVVRFHKKGKKYIFLPQAFGPFTRHNDIERLRKALPLVTKAFAREKDSFNNLIGLVGEIPQIAIAPDFTNLIEVEKQQFENVSNRVLLIPNVNMLSNKSHNPAWEKAYIPLLVLAMDIIREEGFEPVLLNHEGAKDEDLCKELIEQSEPPVTLLSSNNALEIKAIIGSAKAVICSRFHGCVSALSQDVPCLGTSWSHKYECLFEEYGLSENLLQPTESKMDLTNKIHALLNCTPELSNEEIPRQKARAEKMWQQVMVALS